MSSDSVEVQENYHLRIDRLRHMRELRGFSQQGLSRDCGLGINQITRYENGITEPSASVLAKIAAKLGVSTDYLVGLSDTPHSALTDSLRQDERKLLESYTLGDSAAVVKLLTERLYQLEREQQES